jgi:lactate permease
MPEAQVPVDLWHWILATLPIVVLLVFLVPLKWRAPEAGPMAMFAAALVAVGAFRTPWVPRGAEWHAAGVRNVLARV